jgi:predicted metalloprotease with PDZ domain
MLSREFKFLGLTAAAVTAFLAFSCPRAASAAGEPVTIVLDASQAYRGIAYAHERIPVSGPGPFTLVYPKWIPGEHGPTGPLNDLAALRISANGNEVAWQRDQVDLYAFHVNVPAGVTALDVNFDVLLNAPGDVMSTRSVTVINWNRVLMYQEGRDSHDYAFKPSIELPDGWEYGTALRAPVQNGNRVDFAVTPLEMLIDSPLDMGRFVKKWPLWQGDGSFVQLDAFADAPQDLDMPAELLRGYEHLPLEAFALYGSRHFVDYHALLALSDAIGFQGIEHHQSSDDRADDTFLTDPSESLAGGDLIPHEFSHSWNGKYRRPFDLATPNYQVPEKTDLLWVYEGMNQYLGDLLSFRAGIRDPRKYPEYLSTVYADLDYESGRSTTPLIDLTTGAPYFYQARGIYGSLRRSAGDFYAEGELVWLDADTIIRERSHGARSLDTFLHRFTEPSTTGPMVVPYTREQVESLLGQTEPYDWHGFFQKYVYEIAPHPPTDELARAGWKIVYNAKPNEFIEANNENDKEITGWYEYGANISSKGAIRDVRLDSPAWKAGLVPGMTILAVDGQAFAPDVLTYALKRAQGRTTPIAFIVSQNSWFQVINVDYHEGIRYPHLERIEGTPDMLASIMAPHAK